MEESSTSKTTEVINELQILYPYMTEEEYIKAADILKNIHESTLKSLMFQDKK